MNASPCLALAKDVGELRKSDVDAFGSRISGGVIRINPNITPAPASAFEASP
jgi:hypothetical protein